LVSDLLFPADPQTRAIARELYTQVAGLPIVSPHGRVDPGILADDVPFPDPAALLITPDHYLTRMLLSQGIPPGELGVRRIDGGPVQTDARRIWRTFADNWKLFRGTPSKLWLERTLRDVFGIDGPITYDTYDLIESRLVLPEFRPRALYRRFNIEVLATTESPLDNMSRHDKLDEDGWIGRVITTFRPDDVVDLDWLGWPDRVWRLGEISNCDTSTFDGYLDALRRRRRVFKKYGATSSDHGHPTAQVGVADDVAAIYQRALRGPVSMQEGEIFRHTC
jgi:glucuronate isomerase